MSLRSALSGLVFGTDNDIQAIKDLSIQSADRALRLTEKALSAGSIPFAAGQQGMWGNASGWNMLPSTKLDYKSEAGDLTQGSAVMSCIQWLTRTFPEAPLQVKRGKGDAAEVVADHPLVALLTRPNDYYSGILLWMATLASLTVSGNGYWLKVRSRRGDLLQLWYEPHFTIGPTWPSDGSQFISGYRIYRSGAWYDVAAADVVHFRDGIDPLNPRLGLSRLAAAYREVFTDNEAANYSATLLRNMGVPGLVVSPASADAVLNDPAGLKGDIMAKTTGDRRGEPLVTNLPIKVERIAWNPAEMNVRETRRIPEERISALIGIPAIVAGLGAGLDRSTFANMREAREAAYESCIVPTQRLLAAELDTQLLPDLGDPTQEAVGFDLTQVRALQEDRDKLVSRNVAGFRGGVLRRSEARRALGLETTPDDDVFINDLININARITETDPAGTLLQGDPALDPTPPEAAPSTNGHRTTTPAVA